jgi:hypothetical protein
MFNKKSSVSRRNFLANVAIIGASGALGAVFASCKKDTENEPKPFEPIDANLMQYVAPINNSSLMPKYVADDKVSLISAGEGSDDGLYTPEWAKSLVMMEVRILTATPEGTLKSAVRVLDHAAQMGVNALWITPIYDRAPGGNGYGNIGHHTVDPALTGTSDYDEGWREVKNFVDEAHHRNIRIILDVVTWGAQADSSIFREHRDWFTDTQTWGGWVFNWNNEEFREWFIARAVQNIVITGADGYRIDCEPGFAGYELFEEIRSRLLAAGRKILMISEDGSRHGKAFDFEQNGVMPYHNWDPARQYLNPKNFYIDDMNIVASVKEGTGIGSAERQNSNSGGKYRLYTYCLSNHDYQYSVINANRLAIGYQAILAPFIPLWYFGEEFNLRVDDAVFFYLNVNWSLLDIAENKEFFEDVKKYIRIRLMFPEIFTYSPDNHRNTNICTVAARGQTLQAYARFAGNKGIIVVGNKSKISSITETNDFMVTVPFNAMDLGEYSDFTLIDLMKDKIIASGKKSELGSFTATVENQHIGVYLLKGK